MADAFLHHALSFLDLKSLQLRLKCCLTCLTDRGRAHSRSEWFLQPLCRIPQISGFCCELLYSEILHCFLPTQIGQQFLAMTAHHPSLRTLWPSSMPSLQFDDPEKVWAASGLCTCSFIWTALVQQLLSGLPHPRDIYESSVLCLIISLRHNNYLWTYWYILLILFAFWFPFWYASITKVNFWIQYSHCLL